MCSANDTAWIDEFHRRIIEQTDPLAMYYKRINAFSAANITKPKASRVSESSLPHHEYKTKESSEETIPNFV